MCFVSDELKHFQLKLISVLVLIYHDTVSYTHLDVYKRQAIWFRKNTLEQKVKVKRKNCSVRQWMIDVYKRQSLQIFFELIQRYHISVDQFLLETPPEKNTQRRQLDALLDGMSDTGTVSYTHLFQQSPSDDQAAFARPVDGNIAASIPKSFH